MADFGQDPTGEAGFVSPFALQTINGLPLDADLQEELDLDSMDWLNFLVRLHKRFEVDIPESEYASLRTIDDLTTYIEHHQ